MLPVDLRAIFEGAAGASSGGDAVLAWHGASAVHRFVHVVAGEAPVPFPETAEPRDPGREFSRPERHARARTRAYQPGRPGI